MHGIHAASGAGGWVWSAARMHVGRSTYPCMHASPGRPCCLLRCAPAAAVLAQRCAVSSHPAPTKGPVGTSLQRCYFILGLRRGMQHVGVSQAIVPVALLPDLLRTPLTKCAWNLTAAPLRSALNLTR